MTRGEVVKSVEAEVVCLASTIIRTVSQVVLVAESHCLFAATCAAPRVTWQGSDQAIRVLDCVGELILWGVTQVAGRIPSGLRGQFASCLASASDISQTRQTIVDDLFAVQVLIIGSALFPPGNQ